MTDYCNPNSRPPNNPLRRQRLPQPQRDLRSSTLKRCCDFVRRPLSYSVSMQQIQPDQASFLLQSVYLPGLKNEQRITKSIIEAIPMDKGDFRPDDISKSALELAWHIAATEMRFMEAVPAARSISAPGLARIPSNTPKI